MNFIVTINKKQPIKNILNKFSLALEKFSFLSKPCTYKRSQLKLESLVKTKTISEKAYCPDIGAVLLVLMKPF